MIAYEFYWRDPIKGYQRIGVLPEKRKNIKRITYDSIMKWGKMLLGEKVDINDIFFIEKKIEEEPVAKVHKLPERASLRRIKSAITSDGRYQKRRVAS
jgi:hypothetical protein